MYPIKPSVETGLAQNLSNNSVVFHAGANNALVTNQHLSNAGINQGRDTTYTNSPFDFVPNVIGMNGNPLEMLGSTISIHRLFADPLTSPHTLPYGWKPTANNAQGGHP
jgi:hypothetical protein